MVSIVQPRRSFSDLLHWHLINGTRPAGEQQREWTNAEFAVAVKQGLNEKSVRNWRRGVVVPRLIDHIERALFGNTPTGEHAIFRDELRSAYSDALQNVKLDSAAGNQSNEQETSEPITENGPSRSDISVAIHVGFFENGSHNSAEFDAFRDSFFNDCFSHGFHNCDSFHVGGDFTIIKYWQVPLARAEEIRRLAGMALEAFGVPCDPKLVQSSLRSDGRPNITFIVGKKEISMLRAIFEKSEHLQQPTH